MPMPLKRLCELIYTLEETAPVGALTLGEACVWPILRAYLAQEHLFPRKGNAKIVKRLAGTRSKLVAVCSGKTKIDRRFEELEQRARENTAKREVAVLFDSGNRRPYGSYSGFHRILDSLLMITGLQHRAQGIEFRHEQSLTSPDIANVVLPESCLKTLNNKAARDLIDDGSTKLIETERVFREIRASSPELFAGIRWGEIEFHLYQFLVYRRFYRSFLTASDSRLGMLICFYSLRSWAFCAACADLEIPTVEIQHGQQGDSHPMYTHWAAVPADGYHVVPNVFWMWGADSERRLAKWTSQTSRHSTIIGGNPYLALRTQEGSRSGSVGKVRAGKISDVLICLQFSEIPEFVIRVANKLHGVRWHIRLHPRFIADKERLRKVCETSFVDDVVWELDEASSADYYELLSRVDIQLTGWSTTAYEALSFGVPTILTHKNGLHSMRSYVEQGIFRYADDEESLLEILRHPNFKQEVTPYIISDCDVVKKSMEDLFSIVAPRKLSESCS